VGIFRTYFLNNRGDEAMGSTWSYLDIIALGRQEEWEDSPGGLSSNPAVQVVESARRARGQGLRSPKTSCFSRPAADLARGGGARRRRGLTRANESSFDCQAPRVLLRKSIAEE
jgi:hypothetical protein